MTDLWPHKTNSLAAIAIHLSPHESLQSEVALWNDMNCQTNLDSDPDGVCVPVVTNLVRVTPSVFLSAYFIALANNLLQLWVLGSSHYSTEHLQIPEKHPLCRRE